MSKGLSNLSQPVANRRRANVIAVPAKGAREPGLLVTDESACAGRWRQYARRRWIEEAFRDDQSQGLGWHGSRVADPALTWGLELYCNAS